MLHLNLRFMIFNIHFPEIVVLLLQAFYNKLRFYSEKSTMDTVKRDVLKNKKGKKKTIVTISPQACFNTKFI